ncbi:MAG: glycosyl hydrolase [Chloroflexi bacterium OHK40]
MNLYPRSVEPVLNPELFRTPSAEYRGAPFWSWNCALTERRLLQQIDVLKTMGMGGFHIHSRTGLETPYMGPEWLRLVRACAEHARREGLLAWLYDEDCWPSGFGGGLVTAEHQHRAKYLRFTPRPYGAAEARGPEQAVIGPAPATRTEQGSLLAKYYVNLKQGRLASYGRLGAGEAPPAGTTVWYAYVETEATSARYNYQSYVDTLSRPAIERFIQTTHEPYYELLGDDFGGLVPAIFTDEPQLTRKQGLGRADEPRDCILPWTDDLPESFAASYGQRLEDVLPELFWELPGGQASLARYRYHAHVTDRFARTFAGTLSAWCADHGIALTGHMMEEPTLESQTAAIGEAMHSLAFFQLPGIDMLCDRREYTTAKQAQSVARQYGRPGVLSELYGVTNWDYDFVGHKAQGDWQAALGVTVRVHHLTWVSMGGEAKRDYPASIGDHAPWWREYRLVEDHFARLNTALTRGHGLARVAVVHPIESYWLCYGPLEHTAVEREARERVFAGLAEWLLHGLIDFDYVAESLLPTQGAGDAQGALFVVGEASYDAVIVPGMRTIRATTLERLERFREAGGLVIFAGEVPSLVDAEPSARAQELATRSTWVPLEREAILAAVEHLRDIGAQLADGRRADSLLHQIRVDGTRRYVFLCNLDRERPREGVLITLRGEWQTTLLDTLTGETQLLASSHRDGKTLLEWDFTAHGHLLLALEPAPAHAAGLEVKARRPAAHARPRLIEVGRLTGPVPVTLSEPNVLLLDQAEWRLGDDAWQPAEELLRIDNLVRARLGYPIRINRIAQPWVEPEGPPAQSLSLRFALQVDAPVEAPLLAVERPGEMTITLDGAPVAAEATGWYVDEAIQALPLPRLEAGAHELVLTLPYRRKSSLEYGYLLGDFGVVVAGSRARVVAPVRELAFGDWTSQGLPFYGGNVTYHCTVEGRGAPLTLRAAKFQAPLLAANLDGRRLGPIAFAPFELALGALAPGEHRLDITAYGSRVNTFGCVHNADERAFWFGPNAWRTTGDDWSYEYRLKPAGLLAAPRLLREEE